MPWVRVDDDLHSHPKIRRAWGCRAALGLHLLALSYCGRWSPDDGAVPVEFVEEKLPDVDERAEITAALVDAGLWKPASRGWAIHDWADYNGHERSAQARADKARAAAKARWGKRDAPSNAQAMPEHGRASAEHAPDRPSGDARGDAQAMLNPQPGDARGDAKAAFDHMPRADSSNALSNAQASAEHASSICPSNAPSNARGMGTGVVVRSGATSQGNGELDARAVEVDRLCVLFSDLLRERTETPASSTKHRPTARWRTEMRRLIERDGRDPAEIEAAIRWVDKDPFWSSNVLSVPTLRRQYDRLRLRAARDTGGRGPERPASVSELLDRAAAIRAEEGAA